jgi:dTDP-4-dehydrorhamnose 3,5-epimerase
MKVTPLGINGAWLIEAPTYPDDRGLFREWFVDDLDKDTELPRFEVKQANTSISRKGVIRGIHYSSHESGQSKIVTCTYGSILDVIVDLRRDSITFGKSVTVELNSKSGTSIFISSGLGHAFQALEDQVAVSYLLDLKYNPAGEFEINPLDRDLSINWQIPNPLLSPKDCNAMSFEMFRKSEEKNV